MAHQKILVTGGAGFIGSAVVEKLQSLGHEVVVIDNLSFGNRKFIQLKEENFFREDIRNTNELSKICKQINPDWVIHLAAIHFIPYCNQNPYETASVNIEGTISLIESLKFCSNLKKVFFASTAAVYPVFDFALSENHRTGPLDIYGLSKLTGEKLLNGFFLETGIETIICRFFNAFGPNETNAHLIPEIEGQIKSGSRKINLGNLTPKRDFIHTQDMAEAVNALLKQTFNSYEIFNLGQGKEYSVLEIVEAFERQLCEKIEIIQDQSKVRKVDRPHLLADITKIKKITNWEPKWTIDQGINSLLKLS